MNILYLIGNGFDLSLGLKTCYKDFFKYYQSIRSDNEGVLKLKGNIHEDYKNWSDLEIAFGLYTDQIKTTEEFDDVFEDLGGELGNYLKMQEADFDISKVNKIRFFENLVKPEEFLPIADKNRILDFKRKYLNSWYLDIVTFNYTTVIDKILEGKKNIKIGFHMSGGQSVILRGIEHIHGYVDDRMILGVNDESQLANEIFQGNEDVVEAIIKDRCNKSYKHNLEIQFQRKIHQANLICIFGSSLGDTDNIWWEFIGERVKQGIPIIIFTKGEEIFQPRIGYKNNRIERSMREYFFDKAKISNDIRNKFKANIFIALNSLMFNDIYNSK